MEAEKTAIIEKAGKIVEHSGTKALTIKNLARELKVSEQNLSSHLKNDEDIFLFLLQELEKEVNDLLGKFSQNKEHTQNRLEYLFKHLYVLFKHKPYYLSIIFDDPLIKENERIRKAILRIRKKAALFLCQLINQGKKENTFKSKQSTKSLVNGILSSFRLMMRDEELINEMVRKIVDLRLRKD
jgi:AcrR family transcriptional regulator